MTFMTQSSRRKLVSNRWWRQFPLGLLHLPLPQALLLLQPEVLGPLQVVIRKIIAEA